MKNNGRLAMLAIDEAIHDLRAIESEAMDSLQPRCSFRGFIDLASALHSMHEQMPDLIIVGDLPRAGFAASGLFNKLRDAGYTGPIAIVSREAEQIRKSLPTGQSVIACLSKKEFSRGTFQEIIKKVAV